MVCPMSNDQKPNLGKGFVLGILGLLLIFYNWKSIQSILLYFSSALSIFVVCNVQVICMFSQIKNNNKREPTPEVLQKLENCPTLVRTLKKIISVNLEQCANFHVPERRPFVSMVNYMENAKPLLHYHTSLASIFTIMENPMKALPKLSLYSPLIPYGLISVMPYI